MIRASRTPILELPADIRVCYRCGHEWQDSHRKWVLTAPCAACRSQLRREGIDIQQFKLKAAA